RDWFRRTGGPRGATVPGGRGASPPHARRVAGRAVVLAALHYRITFENFLLQRADERCRLANANLLNWVGEVGLLPDFEPGEQDLLQTALGRLPAAAVASESWRLEGLGVLAWALHRYRLPPYDTPVGSAVLEGLELFSPPGSRTLRDRAGGRPPDEIRRYATQITVVHWRLRQFQLRPGSPVYQEATRTAPPWGHGVGAGMDFAAHLRAHPRFQ